MKVQSEKGVSFVRLRLFIIMDKSSEIVIGGEGYWTMPARAERSQELAGWRWIDNFTGSALGFTCRLIATYREPQGVAEKMAVHR